MKSYICKNCGKVFDTYQKKAKYCSRKCVIKSQTKRVLIKCNVCLKTFETSNCLKNERKFCSQECRKKGKYHKFKNEIEFLTPEEKLEKIKQNFNRYVVKTKNGCWNWNGLVDKKGYAILTSSYKYGTHRAYRASYMLYKGLIPKELIVRHLCNNPICTNPDHLAIGTYKDNTADMIKANRQCIGANHFYAKLTDEKVKDIKIKLKNGITGTILAKEYGVSNTTIYDIKNKKFWKHITLEE